MIWSLADLGLCSASGKPSLTSYLPSLRLYLLICKIAIILISPNRLYVFNKTLQVNPLRAYFMLSIQLMQNNGIIRRGRSWGGVLGQGWMRGLYGVPCGRDSGEHSLTTSIWQELPQPAEGAGVWALPVY